MNIFLFLAIGILALLLGYAVGYNSGWNNSKKEFGNGVNADKLVDCFKDVDWTRHTFSANGSYVFKDKRGNEYFLPAPPVIDAIEKMNSLILEYLND